MVRTAGSASKVTGGKASRKSARVRVQSNASRDNSPTTTSSSDHSGGLNPICPRETPSWQKPITNFFKQAGKPEANDAEDVTMMEADVQSTVNDSEELKDNGANQEIEANVQLSHSATNNSRVLKEINVNQDKTATDVDMDEPCVNAKKTKAEEIPDEAAQPRKKIKISAETYWNLAANEMPNR